MVTRPGNGWVMLSCVSAAAVSLPSLPRHVYIPFNHTRIASLYTKETGSEKLELTRGRAS